MNRPVFSNVNVYKKIALESHAAMTMLFTSGRRPKEDGTTGFIVTYDPDQKCFKMAMITIVFTGMWFEALLHLLICKYHGTEVFKKYDFKSYEEKVSLLGFADKETIDCVSRFRKIRKELVHEKAYCDEGEIKAAQDEADNAVGLIKLFDGHCSLKTG